MSTLTQKQCHLQDAFSN